MMFVNARASWSGLRVYLRICVVSSFLFFGIERNYVYFYTIVDETVF